MLDDFPSKQRVHRTACEFGGKKSLLSCCSWVKDLLHIGQNHLETNFAETSNFPNMKTLIAQICVFAETNFSNAKTLVWANQNAKISVFAFGKLVSAKLVSRWFCPKWIKMK